MDNLYSSIFAKNGESIANFLALTALQNLFFKSNKVTKEGESPNLVIKALFDTDVMSEVLFANNTGFSKDQWGEIASKVFTYARDNQIDLMNSPKFNEWVVNNGSRLKEDLITHRYSNYWEHPPTDYAALIESGFLSGGSTPEFAYKRFSRSKKEYLNSFDKELIRSIAIRSPSLINDSIEDVDFAKNFSYNFRAILYSSLANVGVISKKAARKIRSDSSEEASSVGIVAIADNIKKFKNAPEVLSQVMDTKNERSALYLAKTVPKEYLPFMAVCQNQSVRELVVNRMQETSNV